MKKLLAILLLFFFITSFAQNDNSTCNHTVVGKVINKLDGTPLDQVLIQVKVKDSLISEFRNQADGSFTLALDCKLSYQIGGLKENYTKNLKIVYPKYQGGLSNVVIEMVPQKEFFMVDEVKKINVSYIDFITDGIELTPEITKQLNTVAQLMKKYDKMTIEIGFHTNNDSDATYLKALTQKRADFCAEYLSHQGINPERIKAIGYGFSQPVENCKGEDFDKRIKKCSDNKRSEFIVVGNILL